MRKINKDYTSCPESMQDAKFKNLIAVAIREGVNHNFNAYYYRDVPRIFLDGIYESKCAYCESDITSGSPLRVDHFRPKKRIKSIAEHPGYYWLGYEWTNLLLSCEACNSSKSNQFPISHEHNRRLMAPINTQGIIEFEKFVFNNPELMQEGALLLNPEFDNVEEHFVFQPNGYIIGLTEKAKKTIDICGLNRIPLTLARKKNSDDLKRKLRKYLAQHLQGQSSVAGFKLLLRSLFDEILEQQNFREPYSRYKWFVLLKPHIFIFDFLPANMAESLKSEFENYMKQLSQDTTSR